MVLCKPQFLFPLRWFVGATGFDGMKAVKRSCRIRTASLRRCNAITGKTSESYGGTKIHVRVIKTTGVIAVTDKIAA